MLFRHKFPFTKYSSVFSSSERNMIELVMAFSPNNPKWRLSFWAPPSQTSDSWQSVNGPVNCYDDDIYTVFGRTLKVTSHNSQKQTIERLLSKAVSVKEGVCLHRILKSPAGRETIKYKLLHKRIILLQK